MKQYEVTFQPDGITTKVSEGSTLMEVINDAEIYFDFPCGGKGKCGKCRIKVLGDVNPPTANEQKLLQAEELQGGIRLACVTVVDRDIDVELTFSKEAQHQILLASESRTVEIKPHVTKLFLQTNSPTLEDHRPDWLRIKESLTGQGYADVSAGISALRRFPDTLRKADFNVTAVVSGRDILGIEEGNTTGNLFGMAFDIGTTTIAGFLIDLTSGKEIAIASTLNPQTQYGADVISRMNFVSQEPQGLDKLHSVVVEAINKLIDQAATKAGMNKEDIYAVTIAGNTTMHHLFVGITPKYLSQSPFVSVTNDPLEVSSTDLGVNINRAGKVLVLPNIAGFVGADTVGVLLATEIDQSEGIRLIVDIGTNGEIVLGSKEKTFCCSAAAGPAFEGAEITFGMRGAEGAIDHVHFRDNLEYSVIGGVKPKGIAGSALLDVVAGLLELGIVNLKGRILSPEEIANPEAEKFKPYLVKYEGEDAFLIADGSQTEHGKSIVVSQSDIRQLQLAKGAMAAGINILMDKYGIETRDVKEVLLAGAFGNYMNPHSACVIGLIPRELEGRVKMIGNAAGLGSKLALLSVDEYKRAAEMAKIVGHVELASYPNFRKIFAKATYFSA